MSEPTTPSKPITAADALAQFLAAKKHEPKQVIHAGPLFAGLRDVLATAEEIRDVLNLEHEPLLPEGDLEKLFRTGQIPAVLQVFFRSDETHVTDKRGLLVATHPACLWVPSERVSTLGDEALILGNPEDPKEFLKTFGAHIALGDKEALATAIAAMEGLPKNESVSAEDEATEKWEAALEQGAEHGFFYGFEQRASDADAEQIIPLGDVGPFLLGLWNGDEGIMANLALVTVARFYLTALKLPYLYIPVDDAADFWAAIFGAAVQKYGDHTILILPCTESPAPFAETLRAQPSDEFVSAMKELHDPKPAKDPAAAETAA